MSDVTYLFADGSTLVIYRSEYSRDQNRDLAQMFHAKVETLKNARANLFGTICGPKSKRMNRGEEKSNVGSGQSNHSNALDDGIRPGNIPRHDADGIRRAG